MQDLIWFNNHVQPACLPAIEDELFAGERSWVVGWGDTLSKFMVKFFQYFSIC